MKNNISRIGMIGLGKMGSALTLRLLRAGFTVVGFDISPNRLRIPDALASNFMQVNLVEEVAAQTPVIWLMLPAGEVIDETLKKIMPVLEKNTIIIDGGNSHYTDSIRRYDFLQSNSINFLDCGISGGILGVDNGFSVMVGGDKIFYDQCIAIFEALAAPDGYIHCGPPGAGHYVKMVHNGIEYGLLQAYGEGFDLLRNGAYPHLDLAQISAAWIHGAIIRSFILSLLAQELARDQNLTTISGKVDQNGTGKWAVEDALKHHVTLNLIAQAVKERELSQKTGGTFATKIVALLRKAFGGHTLYKT